MESKIDRLIEAWPTMRRLGWKDYQLYIVDSLIAEIERLKAELREQNTEGGDSGDPP